MVVTEFTKHRIKFTSSEKDYIITTDGEYDVDIIEAIMDQPIIVSKE